MQGEPLPRAHRKSLRRKGLAASLPTPNCREGTRGLRGAAGSQQGWPRSPGTRSEIKLPSHPAPGRKRGRGRFIRSLQLATSIGYASPRTTPIQPSWIKRKRPPIPKRPLLHGKCVVFSSSNKAEENAISFRRRSACSPPHPCSLRSERRSPGLHLLFQPCSSLRLSCHLQRIAWSCNQ